MSVLYQNAYVLPLQKCARLMSWELEPRAHNSEYKELNLDKFQFKLPRICKRCVELCIYEKFQESEEAFCKFC